MCDENYRLRTKPNLLQLLIHYASLAQPSRDIWQDRLMTMEGVDAPELSKLHGELIAFSCLEQNTGNIPVIREGAVPGSYRVTLAGLRAIKQIQTPDADVEQEIIEEKPFPKKLKKKRERAEEPELVAS